MGLLVIPLAGRAEVRAIPHEQTKSELLIFETSNQKLYGDNFCFEQIYPYSNVSYNLLSGRLDVHLTTLSFFMEGTMALQKMIDKKNTFLFI